MMGYFMTSIFDIFRIRKSVFDLRDVYGKIDINKVKKEAKILIIDDKTVSQFESNLRKWGYLNVRLMKDLENIDDVANYNLVLCDIQGTGRRLAAKNKLEFEGLTLAEEVKRLYPLIKVLSYSANIEEYKSHYVTHSVVDGFFGKEEDPQKRNTQIDHCLCSFFNPVDIWLITRRQLLDAGASIHEVAKLEDYYVRKLLKKEHITKENIFEICITASKIAQVIVHLCEVIKFVQS